MFIYTLSSSSDPDDIRYVGKAKNLKDRLRRHIGKYYLNLEVNHKNNWIMSELSKGNTIIIDEIESVNESNWEEREKFWIQELKNRGFRLTNSTEGGEGIILTSEIIEKRNETRIKNTNVKYQDLILNYNVKFHDGLWQAERLCSCGKIIGYSYKRRYNLFTYLKEISHLNDCKCVESKILRTKKVKLKKVKIEKLKKEKIDIDLSRVCPNCSCEIIYNRISSLFRAIKENRICNSCKSSGERNYFYGKKLNDGKTKQERFGKKILQYDLEDNLIAEYNSIREASKKTGIDRKSISNCSKGIKSYNTAGGFKFKIKEKEKL